MILQPPGEDPCQGSGSSEQSHLDGALHRLIESSPALAARPVRFRGLVKLAVGLPAAVLCFLLQQWVEQISDWLRLLISGFPGLLALIGLLELISGVPIKVLGKRWDSLQGWQRGLLGTAIVAATLFLVMATMYVFLGGK